MRKQFVSRTPRLLAAASCLGIIAPAAAGAQRAAQAEQHFNTSADTRLAAFHFRSIGPASMGGRLDDIAVSESDPNVIYIGYAVGGVFKSENNGTTFAPVFQTYTTASIGDIAVDPHNPDVVYVGTGEPNNRQTASFGDGIYKSTDGGKTFVHQGLEATQTIARIVIDPRNTNVVYVASPGHLFGPSADRGVYKTTDGGKTWNKIKYVDENTGFTDIVMDPANSNVLYAASYQRRRTSCCFNGGGPGSGLWKTTDAGRTWTRMSGNGLPPGTYGRIALVVSRSNPNIVYAQIEAGATGVEEAPPTPGARGGGSAGRSRYDWCNNGGPLHGFTPARGQQASPDSQQTAPALDASKGGVFRSTDAGKTWSLVSNCDARPMYFSQLRIDASNPNTIYVAGLPVAKSLDGGKTFATLDEAGGNGEPGHVDQHAIWVDPRNPKHLMIGNDGGLDITWDQGRTWDYVNTMATGLAYVVTADMQRPYNVYTGLQDNGSWGGPSSTRNRNGIMNSDWFSLCGGDGFYTAVNPQQPTTVYCESQDGNTNRYDLKAGKQVSIKPNAGPGPTLAGEARNGGGAAPGFGGRGGRRNVTNATPGEAYRFNWNTPYILSPHDPRVMYLGGNKLFRSTDGGDTWVESADLTKQLDRRTVSLMGVPGTRTQLSKNDGLTSYSTIISVSESPVAAGTVWAGTDDGNLQVSRDSGRTFTDVTANLPGLPADNRYWVSRIDASHFDAATAYVAVDGHRSDDLKPYVFVTHDYGKTFTSISSNLPGYGNVQVVREDPRNPSLLFAGTEFGLYTTLDGGKSWEKFMDDYPTVRTDDILIHPRDGDLIVATHGRSVWIADDITPLEQLTPEVAQQDAALFDVRPAVAWVTDYTTEQQVAGEKVFVGENAPRGTAISYYLKSPANGDVTVTVSDASGREVCRSTGPASAGINRVQWTLVTPLLAPAGNGGARGGAAAPNASCEGGGFGGFGRGGAGAAPGSYTATLTVNGHTYTKPVQVLEDTWFHPARQ
jgi:photosystem II stability/assembly factor-like uncharacterized protein